MIVENLNGAPNQFIIENNNGDVVFQSYQSKIAKLENDGSITVYKDYDYSSTTSKYRNIFFNDYLNIPELGSTKKINNAIENGVIKYEGNE